MKLTIIVDNQPTNGFMNDWGWSVLVETNETKILFDADTDPRVVEYNVSKLGINLDELNYIVLSHHHYDHYGGLSFIARKASNKPLYVPPGEVSYLRDWGFNPIIVRSMTPIGNNAFVIPPLYSDYAGLYEIALVLKTIRGPIVIVGCSHPGIDKIVLKALELAKAEKAHLVIGGYHSPTEKQIDIVAMHSEYYSPAHCSGSRAVEYSVKKYPNKIVKVRTASILEIPIKTVS